ncbi:uncharacterized protein LOC119600060, partial [Lucilia sericata]|uniref:uncharacterized protein LOC119600060 n=1 Tax=Lucilia sericata TaxID=13632 RepID=UPI0018A84373
MIGPIAFETLASLCSPKEPKAVPLEEIIATLKTHYAPNLNETAERYKFYTRNQKEGEPLGEYIVELKSLASSCNFGTFLSEALRDRLVCGVIDKKLRARLLNQISLSWEEALIEDQTQTNLNAMENMYNERAIRKTRVYEDAMEEGSEDSGSSNYPIKRLSKRGMVEHGKQNGTEKPFDSLLGRNWLDVLKKGWQENFIDKINLIKPIKNLEKLKNLFPVVFAESSAEPIRKFKASVVIKSETDPIYRSSYAVPYRMRKLVEEELARLCDSGIIEPIKYSDWASPIVVVPKKDSIRICVDFKVTLNRVLEKEHYPLPTINDCLSCLAGSKYFCVLDLAGAYQQVAQITSDNDKSKSEIVKTGKQTYHSFKKGDIVLYRNVFNNFVKWLKAVVIDVLSPQRY